MSTETKATALIASVILVVMAVGVALAVLAFV